MEPPQTPERERERGRGGGGGGSGLPSPSADHDDDFQTPVGQLSPTSPSRKLPDDLPTSLDDRRGFGEDYMGVKETEMYDGWQGEFLLRFIYLLWGADWALRWG